MTDNVSIPVEADAPVPVEVITQSDGDKRQVVAVRGVGLNDDDVLGPLAETAPATDTASSGLNGRLQRIAQRLTSLIAAVGTPQTDALTDAQLRATAVPVTANAGTNLNTSALALEAGGNLAAIAAKDFSTQTTLAAVLAKIIAAPATEAKQDTMITALQLIDNAVAGNEFQVDVVAALPAGTNNIGDVDVLSSALPTGASTSANQANLSAVSTASITTLASAATSAQALASNASRKGLIAHNTDANGVYLKMGTTASATSYSVYLGPGDTWIMDTPVYTGRIDAIWAADGAGQLTMTEL